MNVLLFPQVASVRGVATAVLAVLIFGVLPTRAEAAGEPTLPPDPEARVSYSLGLQIGRDLVRQGAAIDPQALRQGLVDGLEDAEPRLDPEHMRRLLAALKRDLLTAQQTNKRREAGRHREAGAEFLEQNAAREGVTVLASGLQYEVLHRGTGRSPGLEDEVTLHYRGHTLDGHVFFDTYKKGAPARFRVDGVVPGLTEALPRMREGGKWKLFLPPDLGYGTRGPLAHHAVVLEVELLAVEPADTP